MLIDAFASCFSIVSMTMKARLPARGKVVEAWLKEVEVVTHILSAVHQKPQGESFLALAISIRSGSTTSSAKRLAKEDVVKTLTAFTASTIAGWVR